jgi:protoporphyrinogen oxidase
VNPLTILGGGPAGLAVAFYAHRAGHPFTLYERSAALGGLCRTERCGPHRFDTGAHRFHDRDPETTADLRELLGDELVRVDAPSRILLDGRVVDFPPTPLNLILACGPRAAGRIGLEMARRKPRARVASFAEFAEANFGRTLGRKFLLDYSEKLWGLPAERLSADIATRRLAGMTLRTLLIELFRPSRKTAHIDGDFLYPRGGYGRIAEVLARALPPESVRTEHHVVGIECSGGRATSIRFQDGLRASVPGRMVSTLPLTESSALLGDALPRGARDAAAGLRFRDVRVVFLRLARPRVSRNASIYLPDPALAVSRVSEPKNRSASMAPHDETSLLAEVPCSPGERIHALDDAALASRVVEELSDAGLVKAGDVLEWRHLRLPSAYPVYAIGYKEKVDAVRRGLTAIRDFDGAGRNGLFFYSHLHDQMRGARELVRSWTAPRRDADGTARPSVREPAERA